ncbi:unnamed protein product [Phyllotreta striolata]|uniref:alpha-1,2-Mannosidase n=1 Tax=Phyllotreta striolata TaxID=444603 RepID=A0A9N9TRE9_PHYSR|nr:unnamed protein product [Phyllotreta striolata]
MLFNNFRLIFCVISSIFAIFSVFSSCFGDPSSTKKEHSGRNLFHSETSDSSGSSWKSGRMSEKERIELREEARDMFYHAYRAYMDRAYPADELMPLSCKGRYRGVSPSRGDIDDSLGNFSLTLIDTLDTLALFGDLEEFESAVKLVIDDVTFDNDVVVSVFETNIRVLGGLLSAHVIAEYLQQRDDVMKWYKGQLLDKAKDVGYRLLPAFNTTTGIPHSRVNMKYGLKHDKLDQFSRETCTACAGSMILEMAALSRLTGDEIFEMKAQKAMDELWKMRHRGSDLMGTILNVHSGDWIRRDSGVGAGIDSYYEYCLKAYVLLGDDKYLNRFNRHYEAVMKYISQGPMLLDVHMHRPHTNSRNFMDALLAFWPALQVLKGDIKPAVETHEMLYQVMQRHKFIPEAFTTDFRVHWGNHPLRPEFLESTYFLYKATGDPYYLEAGKTVLKSLQRYARVPCGYAAVNDVRTGKKEDRMDSFVLAETLKYLYLLFSGENEDSPIDLDEFLFTTEGHLLPLSLANGTQKIEETDEKFDRTCPNAFLLFPETFRKPLENLVEGTCPKFPASRRRKLTAGEFSPANLDHLRMIKDMGINVLALDDGKVQFLHTYASALSTADAEEGLAFMREMLEFSRHQSQLPQQPQQAVAMTTREQDGRLTTVVMAAGPAQFGENLQGDREIKAYATLVEPPRACEEPENAEKLRGKIAVMERGDCMFVEKVRRVQKAGAVGAIVLDTTPGTGAGHSPFFSMSGDGKNDVTIPAVFLFTEESSKLLLKLKRHPRGVEISLGELRENEDKISSKNLNFGKFEENEENDEFFKFSQSGKNYEFTRVHGKKKIEENGKNKEKLQKIEGSKIESISSEFSARFDKSEGKLKEIEENGGKFSKSSKFYSDFEEEETNVFEKLKISVKNFIDKHTGMKFVRKNEENEEKIKKPEEIEEKLKKIEDSENILKTIEKIVNHKIDPIFSKLPSSLVKSEENEEHLKKIEGNKENLKKNSKIEKNKIDPISSECSSRPEKNEDEENDQKIEETEDKLNEIEENKGKLEKIENHKIDPISSTFSSRVEKSKQNEENEEKLKKFEKKIEKDDIEQISSKFSSRLEKTEEVRRKIQETHQKSSKSSEYSSKIIEIGPFRAILDDYKVKITRNNPGKSSKKSYTNPRVNEEWRKIRKTLLKMLLKEENEELLVPLNILGIYYSTLRGEIGGDAGGIEEVRQTEWLLEELNEEFSG